MGRVQGNVVDDEFFYAPIVGAGEHVFAVPKYAVMDNQKPGADSCGAPYRFGASVDGKGRFYDLRCIRRFVLYLYAVLRRVLCVCVGIQNRTKPCVDFM